MKTYTVRFLPLALLLSPLAGYADSSYEQITQLNGGQLIDSLKNLPFVSKQMKQMTAPTSTTTMVQGNRKAVISKDYTDITDLDREVIIHIDNEKRTYTVTTFADMRKAMEQMPQQIEQAQEQAKQPKQSPAQPTTLQTSFTVSVTDPGASKVIGGYNAKEQIMTMKMIVTDTANPGTNVTYTITSEIWTTPDLPDEMKDVQDFDMRFAKALMASVDLSAFMNMGRNTNASMAQMFAGKPGAAYAMKQMGTEASKIKGTRLLEVTRMGGSGTGMQPAPGTGANQTANGGAPPTADGVAKDTASQSAANELGKLIPGGSLAGAFHKKKATTPPPDSSNTTSSTPPANSTTAPAGGNNSGDVVLMESTTQTTNFSRAAIAPSAFDVPGGYKQVPSAMARMSNK